MIWRADPNRHPALMEIILCAEPFRPSTIGPGCVKTQKNSLCEKIERSERPLHDFLDTGNGHPTHENVVFLHFYTAWARSRR